MFSPIGQSTGLNIQKMTKTYTEATEEASAVHRAGTEEHSGATGDTVEISEEGRQKLEEEQNGGPVATAEGSGKSASEVALERLKQMLEEAKKRLAEAQQEMQAAMSEAASSANGDETEQLAAQAKAQAAQVKVSAAQAEVTEISSQIMEMTEEAAQP